jgi:hypothetical protein
VCVPNTTEAKNSRQSTSSMEWGRMPIIPEMEDDQEGKDVNQGVEGSHSNGHGKEMDKEGHMMKILKGYKERLRNAELIAESS